MPAAEQIPYRLFEVEVAHTSRLSPHFVRIAFTGRDLELFAHAGLDQRIKLLAPAGELPELDPLSPSWYQEWAKLPESVRPAMRTYTARRLEDGVLDIDFALHADPGPASRWAAAATPGDRVLLVGPNARYEGTNHALGWLPPADAREFVLVGDETAVPAIAGILETIPAADRVRVLVELDDAADLAALSAPDRCEVTAVLRHGAPHGERLVEAVRAEFPARPVAGAEPEDVDVDTGILWEVPGLDPLTGGPLPDDDRLGERYYWLAGEAAAIKHLRRHLVRDVGVDRSSVAFMGYWRLGRAEG